MLCFLHQFADQLCSSLTRFTVYFSSWRVGKRGGGPKVWFADSTIQPITEASIRNALPSFMVFWPFFVPPPPPPPPGPYFHVSTFCVDISLGVGAQGNI